MKNIIRIIQFLKYLSHYWADKDFNGLKFGDGLNLFRVKKVDVSSTFIEDILRSGMTLVSSNDIITIKIDRNFFKLQENKQTKKI